MNICVFAGTFRGRLPDYERAAEELGRAIAKRSWTLVYGGAEVGLMGTVADATLAAGGYVIGVMPENLLDWEKPHPRLSELRVTPGILERKREMESASDAFVSLTGGIGTMEEFFEVWTASQLGVSQKPVALLNVNGYYDKLVAFLEQMVAENFLQERYLSTLIVDADVTSLLDRVRDWEPPPAKWSTEEARRLAYEHDV